MKSKIALLFILAFSLFSCNKKIQEGVVLANVTEFEKQLQSENAQLIDVRTPEEFSEGHLDNAINYSISSPDFESELNSLDKSKPVLVYCKKGGRSAKAAAKLKELGFTQIIDLDGGITAWDEAGMPTEKN